MSGESGSVVCRRGRAEMERLAGLYRTSGMSRVEFCRSHGLGLSTLTRYLKRHKDRESAAASAGVERSSLMAVEVAAPVVSMADSEVSAARIVLWICGSSNRRRVEVGRGFDAETLAELVTVLERL